MQVFMEELLSSAVGQATNPAQGRSALGSGSLKLYLQYSFNALMFSPSFARTKLRQSARRIA